MIYIVEDDPAIRELEQYALEANGFQVMGFGSSEGFWRAMHEKRPELVILDVMLPGEDGYQILRRLRTGEATNRLPVIMVTAKSSELDTVKGLDQGADDYLSKPFGIMEFISRVKDTLLRAAPAAKELKVMTIGGSRSDDARHAVTVNGQPVDLTYKEYALLKLLMETPGLVVTRDTIMQQVWGTDISVESRTMDMHIRTLRQKLGSAANAIQTVRKVGYKLSQQPEEDV